MRLFFLYSNKVRIGKNVKVGFSWISSSVIDLSGSTVIGHLNYINTNHLIVSDGKIGHINIIKGDFGVRLNNAIIGSQNKISSSAKAYHLVEFQMDSNSHLANCHLIDMTDSVKIGNRTTIAGTETQIWTHSFVRSKELQRNVRIDAPVEIGEWCYIGARCNIMPGVIIADEITIGAQTVVAKSLKDRGVYVGAQLRFLKFNATERILSLGNSTIGSDIYNKKL